jgi:methionine sulfoxide reductase heme-binding subunit
MTDPNQQVFWFASRALGIVAIILLGVTVAVGLAMSGRLAHGPGVQGRLRRFHEPLALTALGLVAAHGGLLLFDRYLHPGLTGVLQPFALSYRPVPTGLGIIAGWLTAVFALTFYVRRWIGARRWRMIHRFTVVAYLLALIHVIGSGTDARSPWIVAMLTALTAPIVFGFTYRMLPSASKRDLKPAPA